MVDIGQPRWWPLTGIAAMVLIVGGAILPGLPPPADAPANLVLPYFQTNAKSAQIGTYMGALGGVLWVWFSVAFYWVLRRTEVHAVWSLAYLAGVIIFASISTVVSAPYLVLSQPYMKGADGALTLSLYGAFNQGVALATFAGALLCLAASVLILKSKIIPTWLGWLGLASAVAQWASASGLYIASGPLAPNGSVSIVAAGLSALWTIAIAVALMLKPPASAAPQ